MLSYSRGQNVSPAFEGWEKNADGSFNMMFGYMNRNWEEEVDVPVGPDNNISPGVPDQGQPTHFLPRRNRFVFKVRVPADWGKKELVWTLTTKGKTERAYAYAARRLAGRQHRPGVGTGRAWRRRQQPGDSRQHGAGADDGYAASGGRRSASRSR